MQATSENNPADLERICNLALELGVELADDAPAKGPAAVAMWLFDGRVEHLPVVLEEGPEHLLSPTSVINTSWLEYILYC